jgi:hypothetical protein
LRLFVGVEIEQQYFDAACARIEAAHAQGEPTATEKSKQAVRKPTAVKAVRRKAQA